MGAVGWALAIPAAISANVTVLAAKIAPPSVILGLDPKIHAGLHQQ
ncbi:hypothetical protein GR197_12560 [Rhizobium phaseoli]|uniref:Uncharacterized protein n=1 Tax=Rhizobium phaseoli TaxID=396 RepID=A0A7K3UDG1_9HYPH|nr:hypothetical protein [Rhizobium phaseoli]NEJ71364.1 hypothetical protein [Rhizobium phaseoli]